MRRLKFTLFALASLLLCSCSAYKKVPYLQGSEYLNMANVQTPLYDAHIMPKDLLTITVNTSDPDAAIPFNLTVATPITANSKSLTSQPSLQQYLVDNNRDSIGRYSCSKIFRARTIWPNELCY